MSAADSDPENDFRFGRFCVTAHALARCLTAVIPDICDRMFSYVSDQMLDGAAPEVDDATTSGVWLRGADDTSSGYIFIGPPGGQHFYTREKPDGVDEAGMQVQKQVPPGRLIAEVTAFLDQARRLEAGEAVPLRLFNGKEVSLICPSGQTQRVTSVRTLLENALAVSRDQTTPQALRASMGRYLDLLRTAKPAEAAEAASADITAMRAVCAADARLAALSLLRPSLARALPADGSADRLIHKSFESLTAGGDAERMLGRVVMDYTQAGQAALLAAWLDETLLAARDHIEAAKQARSIDAHGDALFSAAAAGFAARAVAQILLQIVAPPLWPPGLTHDMLDGYVGQAEEPTVRTAHALSIAAINAGSGLALERHHAAVQAQGPAKADELIEQYYFYPRCDRNLLVDP